MKVKGLDGRDYTWSLRNRQVGRIDEVPRSKLHLAVRAFLRGLFPTEPLLEEVTLPGSGGLEADFYLPVRRTIVEANGEQHRSRIKLFHPTVASFHDQLRRDGAKRRWCEVNGIRLVVLWHDEEDEWTRLMRSTSG